jgi:hypothetical protein
MRNALILLGLLLLFPAGKSYGQRFDLIGGIGYGQCQMDDLKAYQLSRLNSFPLPAKITEDFPWTLHYSMEFNVQFDHISSGLGYFFRTSDSRVSYSDYSGEMNMDITAIVHGLGPSIGYTVVLSDKIWVGPRFQFPIMFTRITEKNYLRILDETQESSNVIYSWSIGLIPSIEAKYVLSRWSFSLDIGYLLDSKGRLVEGKEMTIYFQNEDYYTSDWSGFQFDFHLGYSLFKR